MKWNEKEARNEPKKRMVAVGARFLFVPFSSFLFSSLLLFNDKGKEQKQREKEEREKRKERGSCVLFSFFHLGYFVLHSFLIPLQITQVNEGKRTHNTHYISRKASIMGCGTRVREMNGFVL